MRGIATWTVNPAVDLNTHAEQVVPDRKLRCARPRYDPGGGGINVARAIQVLGGKACAVWTCGGPVGDLLGRLLDDAGVEHRSVQVADDTRMNLMVRERSTEQQFRFGMPGPRLDADELDACLAALEQGCQDRGFVVLSGSLPPEVEPGFLADAVKRADAADVRVVVDTSGPALEAAVEAGVFLIKPNLRELGDLVGARLGDDEAITHAARELVDTGRVEAVVVSLGAGGAILVSRDHTEHVRAPTVSVDSRVGAGDSMVGGIVLALDRGLDLPAAVRFGVAAGAAATMSPGTELCDRDDTERLYDQF